MLEVSLHSHSDQIVLRALHKKAAATTQTFRAMKAIAFFFQKNNPNFNTKLQ